MWLWWGLYCRFCCCVGINFAGNFVLCCDFSWFCWWFDLGLVAVCCIGCRIALSVGFCLVVAFVGHVCGLWLISLLLWFVWYLIVLVLLFFGVWFAGCFASMWVAVVGLFWVLSSLFCCVDCDCYVWCCDVYVFIWLVSGCWCVADCC